MIGRWNNTCRNGQDDQQHVFFCLKLWFQISEPVDEIRVLFLVIDESKFNFDTCSLRIFLYIFDVSNGCSLNLH